MKDAGVPESFQTICLPEDTTAIAIRGFAASRLRRFVYWSAVVATAGGLYVLARWYPALYIAAALRPAPLAEADCVEVFVDGKHAALEPVRVSSWDGRLETGFGAPKERPDSGSYGCSDVGLRLFTFRHRRFVFCTALGRYACTSQWKDPAWAAGAATGRAGLDDGDAAQRALLFGRCVIDVDEKSYLRLLWDEALNPLYIFQVASIAIWCASDYYYYSGVIFAISALSIAVTVVTTKRTTRRIHELSAYVCSAAVLREGQWRVMPSSDLVPGDIIDIAELDGPTLPCDAVLLEGDCIVDESMLTGECIPESKAPLVNGSGGVLETLDMGAHTFRPAVSRHLVFAGTKLVRVRAIHSTFGADAATRPCATAMVLRTGFCTTRGSLVRSILYPHATRFNFYRDALRFVWLLAGVAVIGLIINTINLHRIGVSASKIARTALNIITIVVPPALPAAMSIGMAFATERLRKAGVFCISPSRINVASKVAVMCFDKTNTLTEAGLDLLGVQLVSSGPAPAFRALEGSFSQLKAPAATPGGLSVTWALAACHSLHVVDGALVGDPLEAKMFEFSGWHIKEGDLALGGGSGSANRTTVHPPDKQHAAGAAPDGLEIARVFEFASELRRSSVVVRLPCSRSADVYVKGAPETICELCAPESVPEDVERVLEGYTRGGYRVIALAGKHIGELAGSVDQLERADVERGLEFMGLMVFENRLKPATAGVLRELKDAAIRLVMCTGDNPLTAVSIARDCGLVDGADSVFISRLVALPVGPGDAARISPLASVAWTEWAGPGVNLDPETLAPVPADAADCAAAERARLLAHSGRYCVAVTGDVFAHMERHARETDAWKRLLMRSAVYARMSPEQKAMAVAGLQALGYTAGFCGDGANDCAALKAADVGVSLSEAEASVAAPFTARTTDISCVTALLKEGRCSMATSFSCFKFMALYSMIQFTTCCLLYVYDGTPTNAQFLFADLFTVLPIAVCMDRFEPFARLVPKRPSARLMGRKTITSLVGGIVIVIGLQVAMFFMVEAQSWYRKPQPSDPADPDSTPAENSLATTLFLFSSFQYLSTGVVLSIGPPYRQPAHRSLLFVAVICALLAFDLWALLGPVPGLRSLMGLVPISVGWRLTILGMAAANFALCVLGERVVFPWLAPPLAKLFRLARLVLAGTLRVARPRNSGQPAASDPKATALLSHAGGARGLWARLGQR
ncbi:hypothetical protein H4R21_000960, partial [Coemansia helicoidea]